MVGETEHPRIPERTVREQQRNSAAEHERELRPEHVRSTEQKAEPTCSASLSDSICLPPLLPHPLPSPPCLCEAKMQHVQSTKALLLPRSLLMGPHPQRATCISLQGLERMGGQGANQLRAWSRSLHPPGQTSSCSQWVTNRSPEQPHAHSTSPCTSQTT